jgi:thymidylate synthase ThyX
MRASSLHEVRSVAEMMLEELNQVMDVFLQRVDQPNRGGVWSRYLAETQESISKVTSSLTEDMDPEPSPRVELIDWDTDAEEKLVAAMLYASSNLSESQLRSRVAAMSSEERIRVVESYVGDRRNRRHKPGRAFERINYRFDVLADYGAFRDLQRHRMLTLEWQDLSALHSYEMSEDIEQLGLSGSYEEAMEISADLWGRVAKELPKQAQYCVCMAYRIRFVMQMNAREAMHLIELRSSPQGHPSYRVVAHDMHRLIEQVAGHKAVARAMSFVDFNDVDLERLEAERDAERKRQSRKT